MYITAAEFNMISSALAFAADRVLESKGDISVFTDDPETNIQDAQAAIELVSRLESTDVYARDWALIAETYDNEGCCWNSCLDIINELYYDDYGRLRKAACAVPTPGEWITETKRTHTVGLDVFPADALELAHDVLGDLWLDNEMAGDHNPDGTFKVTK